MSSFTRRNGLERLSGDLGSQSFRGLGGPWTHALWCCDSCPPLPTAYGLAPPLSQNPVSAPAESCDVQALATNSLEREEKLTSLNSGIISSENMLTEVADLKRTIDNSVDIIHTEDESSATENLVASSVAETEQTVSNIGSMQNFSDIKNSNFQATSSNELLQNDDLRSPSSQWVKEKSIKSQLSVNNKLTNLNHQMAKGERISEEFVTVNGLETDKDFWANLNSSQTTCVDSEESKTLLNIIFDCCDVEVISVRELLITSWSQPSLNSESFNWFDVGNILKEHTAIPDRELDFFVEKWCVRISKASSRCGNYSEEPFCIRVNYRTKPCGSSVKWTSDQDNNLCAFTHGHWINNRSLFPGQDSPIAMATWEANIHVPPENTVLMSGDSTVDAITDGKGLSVYTYSTSMPMPISTLALAIGQWSHVTICEPISFNDQVHNQPDCLKHLANGCPVNFSSAPVLPCRLFAPPSMLPKAEAELKSYMAKCMTAANQLLGNHPFTRLDILVVPPCFASLALACPSLMFISQSLLPGDQSACIRLAHELSHSWFGLLIGPSDWTEEWLTEGFATYLEDCIHAKAMVWEEDEGRQFSELRAAIRHRTLSGELTATDEDLQVLRPNKSESPENADVVKHGMNPNKTFTQVHYLKGYFLLRYLSSMVGVDVFNKFIKSFISRYHGDLITSQNVFDYFFETFPELRLQGLSCEQLYQDWLDCPGMPKPIEHFDISPGNKLVEEIQSQFLIWKPLFVKPKRQQAKKAKLCYAEMIDQRVSCKFIPDQTVLLLEWLLDLDSCPGEVLNSLGQTYGISTANSDVVHRWCELIIKHKYQDLYDQVENFLIDHQAMGVYLFGELVISEDVQQRQLAESCFGKISADIEEGPYKIVHDMLYGIIQ